MTAIVTDGSLLAREDTVSRDYTFAFSMGPVELSSTVGGVFIKVWQIKAEYDADAEAGSVSLRRANDAGDGWNDYSELFTYEGVKIEEVDLGFDQTGHPTVCAHRLTGDESTPEVWLYWFKSTEGEFVFELISAGKTPRILLDSPEDISNSDLLLFYLNTDNQRVEWRTQSELYATAELVPTDVWFDPATEINILQDDTENTFLEEVARTKGGRLQLIMSTHDPLTGKYSLMIAETVPYPQSAKPDSIDLSTVLTSFDVKFSLFSQDIINDLLVSARLSNLTVLSLVSDASMETEKLSVGAELSSFVLSLILRDQDTEVEELITDAELTSFDVSLFLIDAPAIVNDLTTNAQLLSFDLIPA